MNLNAKKFVFGTHAVKGLLKTHSHLVVKMFCLSNSLWIKLAAAQNLPYQICSSAFFRTQFHNFNHQGIVVEITAWPYQIWKQWWKHYSQNVPSASQVILIVDHLESSYNLGAIIRTAAAYNVQALLLPKRRQAQINAFVAKTSSGGLFQLPIVLVPNLATVLKILKQAQFWIVTTALNQPNLPSLPAEVKELNLGLVIGNEQKGVHHNLTNLADFNFVLPLHNAIPSLNVSVATGIILYAIQLRQKPRRS